MIDIDSVVCITNPRYPSGPDSWFRGKLGLVVGREGRVLDLKLFEDNETYSFWLNEVDLFAFAC
jgi:ribosomal protein L21E